MKTMGEQIRELKKALIEGDEQTKNLEALVTKFMSDLKQHEEYEETLKKQRLGAKIK
jgi:predicted transcriptional regulator